MDRAAGENHQAAPRVLIFVEDLSATGVVRNALALAARLCDEGFRVDLAASRADGVLRGELDRRVSLWELLGPAAAARSRPARLAWSLRAYRRRLAALQPDVVISAGNHGHILTRLAAAAAPGARIVYRISNDLDHRIAGRPTQALGAWARAVQFRLIARHADRLVLVSPHLLRHPSVAAAQRAGRIRLIPNGVDVALVRKRASAPCPHPWLAGNGVPTVVAIGRIVPQKNFETLLAAVATARRRAPIRLLLIGKGSPEALSNLRQEAGRLGIAEAVDIVAPVANPFAWMARAAVVAIPSRWEGASNIILEAMACGSPIVASKTAGNAEDVLANGEYGLLVDPDDVDAMAEALLVQSGDAPRRPGDRVLAFDRSRTLDAYVAMVGELAPLTGTARREPRDTVEGEDGASPAAEQRPLFGR